MQYLSGERGGCRLLLESVPGRSRSRPNVYLYFCVAISLSHCRRAPLFSARHRQMRRPRAFKYEPESTESSLFYPPPTLPPSPFLLPFLFSSRHTAPLMPESPYFSMLPVSRMKQVLRRTVGRRTRERDDGERANAEAASEGTDLHLGIRALNRKLSWQSLAVGLFLFPPTCVCVHVCVCVCVCVCSRHVCVSLRAANGFPSR